MPSDSFKIPEKNGEFLLSHPKNLVPYLLRKNKEKIKAYNFTIEEENVQDFRKKIREKVINLSLNFTSGLGIKNDFYRDTDTIVQTGHQPDFYHPGILIKNLLLNKIKSTEKVNAINLIVDSDIFGEMGVNIPAYIDGITKNKEILLSNPYHTPYEFILAPTRDLFDLFTKKIGMHLSHPQFKSLYINFSRFVKNVTNGFNPDKYFETISDFMTFIRRIYEDEVGSCYLEVPVSYICNTDEFLTFFISIAKRSEKFADIYNNKLGKYRMEHKFRYPVNPFPNLKVDGKKIELPFWHYCQENEYAVIKRKRVFSEVGNKGVKIYFEDGKEINFSEKNIGIDIIRKSGIKIRPKAITLTLFNRIFVSDVFIHGVGGAKYDRITDEIIRDFYGVEPPEFITTSLTLYPAFNLSKGDGQDEIRVLEKRLREMRYNPERYIKDIHEEKNTLKEKETLISLLNKDNADKKEIAIRLKTINEKIYQKIKSEAKDVEDKIELLKKQQGEVKLMQIRDYPYFLFSPEEFTKFL